jgi:hypothetical protein
MNIGYVSTLAVLAGSVIGGLTSTSTTWVTQRAHARTGLLADKIVRREELYRDFVTAASRAYGDALISSEPRVPDLVALYSMISQMRVVSAPVTVACADKIILFIIDTYFSPNRSVRDLRELIRSGEGIDPLKEFSEAAREELGDLKFR